MNHKSYDKPMHKKRAIRIFKYLSKQEKIIEIYLKNVLHGISII